MSSAPNSPDPVLRSAHRAALGLLALFAIGIAMYAQEGGEAPAPFAYTATAMGLAIASIMGRRLAAGVSLAPARRRTLEIVGLAAAVGIGGVALAQLFAGGERQDALLFVLGALILSLRPPAAPKAP